MYEIRIGLQYFNIQIRLHVCIWLIVKENKLGRQAPVCYGSVESPVLATWLMDKSILTCRTCSSLPLWTPSAAYIVLVLSLFVHNSFISNFYLNTNIYRLQILANTLPRLNQYSTVYIDVTIQYNLVLLILQY